MVSDSIVRSDLFKLFLVLFLSFLIGLEREEKKAAGHYAFGGVRTYPLIGLVGYSMAFLSNGQSLALAIGLIVVGSFMLLSYWYKINSSKEPGLTSEIVGLATYLLGALVYYEHFWIASTLAIASLILLELKSFLEGLARRFSSEDILTFTKFLFLTIVILPILPDREFSAFQINPFKTWLVVVAVSTISYGSFLLQKRFTSRGGIALVALLGGAYSSTITTVALAKQSSSDRQRPHSYAGAILMASGVMYLRLAILISLFNPNLAHKLLLPFAILALIGIIGGWCWTTRAQIGDRSQQGGNISPNQNPLELRAAFVFAALFVIIVVLTHYTALYLGKGGIYTLAGIMGITDVDPFILGLTQSAGKATSISVAAAAIAIAASSNNLVKGFYAIIFADRPTGKQSLFLLIALAFLGLIPLFWLL